MFNSSQCDFVSVWFQKWNDLETKKAFLIQFILILFHIMSHDQLKKAESSLTIQICIEKIDCASFLHRRKVFDVKSIFCRCDWDNQTIKHVIMFCSLINDRNQLFRDVDINDYHVMTHSSKRFKTIVKWLLQHDLLQQFSLIIELLYEF
jgi:hypothetical protein